MGCGPAAKSPNRPSSDAWRPLGQLCYLASVSHHARSARQLRRPLRANAANEGAGLSAAVVELNSEAAKQASARKTGTQSPWTRESTFAAKESDNHSTTMSGYIGVGSLSSPPPRQGDPRNQHLVSGDEIMRRARSSLPNPPAGQQWIRVNNDWQLVSTPDDADASPVPPEPSAPREHVVLPSDTLQGLCLRYKTTARKLKQANPSLDLGNSSLRGVAVLRIPGSGPAQPVTEEVQMARLRAAVPSLSAAEARFYLSVEATVEGAVARARADAAWERGNDWSTARSQPEPDRGVEAAVASAEAFIRHQEPLGRLIAPDEIAAAIAWLCSPGSSAITGAVLSVDGGMTATP